MKVNVDLTEDSANSYVDNKYVDIKDLGDKIRFTLDFPERSFAVNKKELIKVIELFKD